jgi:hypothetical protein
MVAVGVTGHRFLTEIGNVNAGIDRALVTIQQHFAPPMTVFSSLAEGADRLVVHRVLARAGSRLIVPLPLACDEYMKDFESAESKEEFRRLLDRADEIIELPPTRARSEAYGAAGLYVLDHCDVLIAVWNGQRAEGQGGTAEIVARARTRKLPIAWVAGDRKPGTQEPTSLGAEQGIVTFVNFPSDARGDA